MPIINVKVIENFFTTEQKNALVPALTDAFCNTTFQAPRPYINVVIEEVKQGQWGLGGVRLPDPDFLINGFAAMVETAAVELSRTYHVPITGHPPEPPEAEPKKP